MKRYESYKDSGVEWIGEIPSHWDIDRVKRTTYVKGRIGWKGLRSEDFIDEGPYLITGTDFHYSGRILWDNMYHVSQERYDEDPFIQVRVDDVLITKDGSIGKVVHVDELKGQTCLNSGIFITRPLDDRYIGRYFFWTLNSHVFGLFVDLFSGGSTILHLYQNVFERFSFPLPPLPEQEQIVSFLDEKTFKIDDLIKKKEQKIELLKEYRTSLINRVITKGLNPDVPMKDSGVEWIGEIPSHWVVSKVKYHYDLLGGYPFDSEDITNEIHQYPVIRIGNVSSGKVDVFYSGELNDKHPVVHSGDLIVSLTGDFSIRQWDNVPSLLNQRCGLIRNNDPDVLDRVMFYLIPFSLVELGNTKYFTTLKNLSNSEFLDIGIVLPSLSEQEQIVSYLDQRTGEIDSTIESEKKKIDLLKEYRQSLISSVITGKIKVVD